MSSLRSQLERLERTFDALAVDWCLVGGLAVSTHVEPRLTRDVDVAVAVADDKAAERLIRDLAAAGYRPMTLVEQEATGRLATVRFQPPGEADGGVIVDLLFASSGIEPEIVGAAQAIEVFSNLRAPIARMGHLLALKVLARDDVSRPQDIHDIRRMLAAAGEDELARAREALQLIEARGFHRNRRLLAALDALLEGC